MLLKEIIRFGAVCIFCNLLAACAHAPSETRIVVKEVKVPIPVACVKDLPEAPVYPDTDAAIRAAKEPGEMLQLLAAGRLVRIQRLSELEIVAAACK